MKILKTSYFQKWYSKIKDRLLLVVLARKFDSIEQGNLGKYKILYNDLFEFKIYIGQGYRVYFSLLEDEIVLLLVGGDKSTQEKDIKKAQEILKEFKDERRDK